MLLDAERDGCLVLHRTRYFSDDSEKPDKDNGDCVQA